MCETTIERMFSIWQNNSILFNLSANGRKSRDALQVLNGQTKRVIAARRSELTEDLLHKKSIDHDDDDGVGQKKKFAFLDSLLRAQSEGAQISDKMIEDEVNTFMFEVNMHPGDKWTVMVG